MKLSFFMHNLGKYLLWIICLLVSSNSLLAEGSKDFRDYPGYRLFFNAEQRQQLKVYAAEGETINIGTSHVGISGGFISVFRPDGSLHYIFNGSDGLGIINNDVEEMAGPTGGGTINGPGYIPATAEVGAGQGGIWTIQFLYPDYSQDAFTNLMNNAAWSRNDQPIGQRVVLAWDITVSKNAAANRGGTMVEGRVYSNEYISIQNGNDIMTSPSFYVLTKDGFQYQIDFQDTDPWGFPIFSNSVGLVTENSLPCYQSAEQTDFIRSDSPEDWTAGNKYLYEPQAEGAAGIVNNKIFFNIPDPTMPTQAMVTDILTYNTHTTWLYREIVDIDPEFENIGFKGVQANNSLCDDELITEVGKGGFISFNVNTSGTARVMLDLNNNGNFDDAVDRDYFQRIETGENLVVWDGKDGEGNIIPETTNFRINYRLEIRGGEIHMLMLDVENNPAGVSFTRLNGPESPNSAYFYDHSKIGGPVSGAGISGNAQATSEPFTYSDRFGNNRLLDYWAYTEYSSSENGGFSINVVNDCSNLTIDDDMDGDDGNVDDEDETDGDDGNVDDEDETDGDDGNMEDEDDMDGDDGNMEDEDETDGDDGNMEDEDDMDGDDGNMNEEIDSDLDRIPDFLDLDDDNDGIPDFSEYCNPEGDFVCLPGGVDPTADNDNDNIPNYLDSSDPLVDNNCVDANEDGICDVLSAIYDTDGDGVPDHLDLDSDNDGITDLVEAGHLQNDLDGNGIIDGDNSFFGGNGFFNALASDPDAFTAFETYNRSDADRDGVPDSDDLDSDNDGINDVIEANYGFADSNADGRIDDGNGNVPIVGPTGLAAILDPVLTNMAIPLPPDTDTDGVRDWHDLDADNDGINDVVENLNADPDNDGIIGEGIPITDNNGQVTTDQTGTILIATFNAVNTDETGAADFRDLDADGDGINDVNEADQPDDDGDGRIGTGIPVVNAQGQIIEDGIGVVLNTISNPEDTDEDQIADFQDIDRDGDGILDSYECPGGWPCANSDDDLLADVDDLDSDNDKLLDEEECPGGAPCPDTNTNSLDNFLEFDCNTRNTPTPFQSVGGGQFCEGTPVSLNANGDTSFTEMITYRWTGPNDFEFVAETNANTSFPVDLIDTRAEASGTYELVLETTRGCQSEPLKVVVDLMAKPLAPALSIENNERCTGDAIALEVNTFSGEEVTYIWYNQTNGEPFIVDTTNIATLLIENATEEDAGIYTAIVNVNGCESSLSNGEQVKVKMPLEVPTATSSATFLNPGCEGETVTLSVPFREGATYEWTGPANFFSNRADPTLTNTTTINNGMYNVLVTFEGCSVRTNNVSVMVNPTPSTPVLRMEEAKPCEGASATLTIIEPVNFPENNSLQFDWFAIGSNTPITTTNTPIFTLEDLTTANNGDYYVAVSSLGCTSEASNVHTIEVTPALAIAASASATPNMPACEGESVRLIGSLFANATYAWYGPDGLITDQPSTTLRNATPEVNGAYSFGVTIDGCTSFSEDLTIAVNPQPATPIIVLDNPEPCTGENIAISITNFNSLDPNSVLEVDWFNSNTGQLVTTTNDLTWMIDNLDNIDEGSYHSVLSLDGCLSGNSNIQEISTQPGLEAVPIFSNAEAGVSPICEGGQVNLAVPFEEGITYQWFGPNGMIDNQTNNLIIENASAEISGNYYIVREKAGCSRTSEEITIQVSKKPATPELVVMAGPQCLNGEVTFNINNPQEIPSGSEVLYSWFNVQTNEQVGTSTHPIFTLSNLTAANTGTYYAVLTVDGCSTLPSNVGSVIVQSPPVDFVATASAGIDSRVCEGENVGLNVPFAFGTTYEWFGPNGFTSDSPNPTIPAISEADAGNYYAVVTANLCPVLTNEITIGVKPKPEQPSLNIDNTQQCEGESATLTVTKPTLFPEGTTVVYEWFTSNSDVPLATTDTPTFDRPNLQTNDSGNLFAVVTQDGCVSEASNEIALEVSAIPNELAFIQTNTINVCEESEIMIEAVQPMLGTGEWLTAADVSIVDPLNPSTFLLDIPMGETTVYWSLSFKGCNNYAQDSLVIRQEDIEIFAQDDAFTIELNSTLEQANVIENDFLSDNNNVSIELMTQPESGTLTFENGIVSYEPDPNFFGTDIFEYEVCNSICPSQCDIAQVAVKVVDSGINADCFAPNVITPNNDGMNDCLKIPCVENQAQSSLKIFNRWGDLVHETEEYQNDWAGTYNGNPLPNGTYFYLLRMADEASMQGYFTIVR